MSGADGKQIFISYASADYKKGVELVVEGLKKRGFRVFLDQQEIRCGGDVQRILGEGIKASDGFVLFYSRNAKKSNWVAWELRTQQSRNLSQRQEIQCFPVRLDDTELPIEVEGVNFTELRHSESHIAEDLCNDIVVALCGQSCVEPDEHVSHESDSSGEDFQVKTERLWNESIDSLVNRMTHGLMGLSAELRAHVEEILNLPRSVDYESVRLAVRDLLAREVDDEAYWMDSVYEMEGLIIENSDQATIRKVREIQRTLVRLAFPKSVISQIAESLLKNEPFAINALTSEVAPRVVLDILRGMIPGGERIGGVRGNDGVFGRFEFERPPADGAQDHEEEMDDFLRDFLSGICEKHALKLGASSEEPDADFYANKIRSYIQRSEGIIKGKLRARGVVNGSSVPLFYCFVPIHRLGGRKDLWLSVRDRMTELNLRLAFFVADTGENWPKEQAEVEVQVEECLLTVLNDFSDRVETQSDE